MNHPGSCWESSTAGHKPPRLFLECIGDNSPPDTGDEVSKKNLLCLIINNVEKLGSSRKVRGSLGCSDDEMRMGQGNW